MKFTKNSVRVGLGLIFAIQVYAQPPKTKSQVPLKRLDVDAQILSESLLAIPNTVNEFRRRANTIISTTVKHVRPGVSVFTLQGMFLRSDSVVMDRATLRIVRDCSASQAEKLNCVYSSRILNR